MDPNFEQDIPMPAIIAGFIVLLVVSSLLRKKFRERRLVREGQLVTESGRIPSINQRVAGNREWAKGEISSRGRTMMIVLGTLALFMNLTIGVGFVKSFSNPDIPTAPRIVLGVFALISVVIGVFAVRAAIRYFRFGESKCYITGKAGVLGSSMAGVIRSNTTIDATGEYTIELECLETYTTGSGKNSRTEVKRHWQSKQRVLPSGSSLKRGIPFSFDLPKYPPETGYQLARGSVHWRLSIHAPVKGVDYSADFVVPIFKMDYSE